jgi:hypothetical protein
VSCYIRVVPDLHIPGKSILFAPIARFVIGDDSADFSGGYTLGHPAFASFLQESQYRDTPLLKRCQKAFLDWGEEVLSEINSGGRQLDAVPVYLLDFYPQHLVRQKNEVTALAPILSNEWVEACRRARKETALAVAIEAVLEAVVQFIDRPGPPDPVTVTMAIRASLFLASLRQAASFTEASLLVLAIEHGLLDQKSALARTAFLEPRERVKLLLHLARTGRPGLDPIALWYEACAIAINDRSPSAIFLLDEVLKGSDIMLSERSPRLPTSVWPRFLKVIEARLTLPSIPGPSFVLRFDLIGNDKVWSNAPLEQMIELARLVLNPSIAPAILPALMSNFAKTAAPPWWEPVSVAAALPWREPVSSDGVQHSVRPMGRLVDIFAALMEDARCDHLARVITEILNSRTGEVGGGKDREETIVETYLAGRKDRDERITGAAVLLGFLIGTANLQLRQIQVTAQQAVLNSIVSDTDANFMVQLIASGVLQNSFARLPQSVCDGAWQASAAIEPDHIRIFARAEILRLMSDKSVVLDRMKEEVHVRLHYFEELINVGVWSLSPQQSSDLLDLIPPYPERDGMFLRQLIERAKVRPSRGSVRRTVSQPAHELTREHARTEEDEEREFDHLLKGQESLDEVQFNRALDLARHTKRRYLRVDRIVTLTRFAPAGRKRALIDEALTESGAIDDRGPAAQAICGLARLIEDGKIATFFDEALALISQIDPLEAVYSACNVASNVPRKSRAAWARRAVEAARQVGPEHPDAKAYVVSKYRQYAPVAFVLGSLRAVSRRSDEKAVWTYNHLLDARGSIGALTAATALVRHVGMTANLRIRINGMLRSHYPRLLFWLPPTFGVNLDALEANQSNLTAVADLIRSSRGQQRRRILLKAVELFGHVLNKPWADLERRPFSSSMVIRSIYDGGDGPTRETLKKIIHECEDKELRLDCEIALFQALAEKERIEIGPRLLRSIAPTTVRQVTASLAWQQFTHLHVLFLAWPGDMSKEALTGMLRVGAHNPRSRWLYDLPGITSRWPAEKQAQLSTLLEAVRDALRLWP